MLHVHCHPVLAPSQLFLARLWCRDRLEGRAREARKWRACRVPLAPPHTLVLEHSHFRSFPTQANNSQGEYLKTTGDVLRLRRGGQEAQCAFKHSALAQATADLFYHPDWDAWTAQLEHAEVDWEEYGVWRREHSAWEAGVRARKAAKARGEEAPRRPDGERDGALAAPARAAWASLQALL